jgi:hypothetical protein
MKLKNIATEKVGEGLLSNWNLDKKLLFCFFTQALKGESFEVSECSWGSFAGLY